MKCLRGYALAVLVFLGVTAVVGAVPMMMNPNGSPLSMPQSFLTHSPFHSYLIPGIVLLLFNGLSSFVVLGFAIRRRKFYGWLIGGQGVVLLGWLAVEVAILRFVIWPHWFYAGVAAFLILSGWALRNDGSEMKIEGGKSVEKHAVHSYS